MTLARRGPRLALALLALLLGAGWSAVAGANTIEPHTTASCLSPQNTCSTVTFDIARSDAVGIRGFSVTFTADPVFATCGAGFAEGGYLNNVGATTFQVVNNGGFNYTVDCAILGAPCGATAVSGTLFSVDLAAAVANGTGTITVTSVTLRDCSNGPVSSSAGTALTMRLDSTGPSALASLAATQDKTANGTDGRTNIDVTWSAVSDPDAVSIDIYHKGFGAYPEYDDSGGAAPTAPATPAAALSAGWTLVASLPATATSVSEKPATRDFWYYMGFVTDGCGNISAVSSMTGGTLDYHLGDVAPAGTGNNSVATIDVSQLGSTYGLISSSGSFLNDCDVGPTTNGSVDARPTTDNRIQFEDLILFAINYGQVSKMPAVVRPAAAVDQLALRVPTLPAMGETFDVELSMSGTGRALGVSTALAWNASSVEPISARAGEWLNGQAGTPLLLSPQPGIVDAAALGAAPDGLRGTGTLALVTFRVTGAGNPEIAIASVDARDAGNQPVPIALAPTGTSTPVTPRASTLYPAVPNPFNPATTLLFTVAQPGHVTLRIYTLDGRAVRTLVDEELPSGERSVVWNGRDDAGRAVSSGGYVARLDARDASQSQRLTLIK